MHHSILADHAQHDLELIAGHAAGDLTDSQRTRADALLQSCTSCADLQRDLLALASATRTLPRMASAPRDFRIARDRAAQLRRGGWLRAILRPFGAPRSAVRPVAMAFTSLGLAGLLLANLGTGLLGSAGSAPRPADLQELATGGAAATSAPVLGPVAGQPQPSGDTAFGALGQPSPGTGVTGIKTGDSSSAPPRAIGDGSGSGTVEQPTGMRDSNRLVETTLNPFILLSMALLALGVTLFGLRFIARHLR